MVTVGQADLRGQVVRPAAEKCRECNGRRLRAGDPPHRHHRRQIVGFGGADRNDVRRRTHHRPILAVFPGVFEHRQRHHQAALFARAQHQFTLRIIVADHHRVMPERHRPHAVILQHDHRRAGRDFAQQVGVTRRQLIRHHVIAARRGQHLDLQAALARRQIDLRHQHLRRDLWLERGQGGGQRGRAALVIELRKKRYLGQFDTRRQANRPGITQRTGLRRHQRAAAQSGEHQKNARQTAGAARQRSKPRHFQLK